MTRALVVTDGHLAAIGLIDPVVEAIRAAGVEAEVFAGSGVEPSEASVTQAIEAAREGGFDGFVGLGGGSTPLPAKTSPSTPAAPAPSTTGSMRPMAGQECGWLTTSARVTPARRQVPAGLERAAGPASGVPATVKHLSRSRTARPHLALPERLARRTASCATRCRA